MNLLPNHNLQPHNTFGIRATARWYASYASVEELQQMLQDISSMRNEDGSPYPLLHIGGGSNLLFLKDYEGIVLQSAIHSIEVCAETAEDIVIRVGSGLVFDELIEVALSQGWYGLENLSLIPGEVGAAAVQNIGAYGVEAKDFITLIELVDLHDGSTRTMTHREAQYAYRYSILKDPKVWGRYAVTYVHFHLRRIFQPHLSYAALRNRLVQVGIEEDKLTPVQLRDVIIEMRQQKLPDPKVLGNAGSFFMNPILPLTQYQDLLASYPDMPHYPVDASHVKVPAAWLIERAGWKGRRVGNVGVYDKQALVLVNHGEATGQEVAQLSDHIRQDVQSQFGIDIHPEVNFIG